MPALPAVPSVVRVDLNQSMGEDVHVLNRLFYHFGGALSNADAATWANTIQTDMGTDWAGAVHSDWGLLEVVVTDLTSATAAVGIAASTVIGSEPGTVLPAEDSMVFEYKVARRYRGGKPKSFTTGHVSARMLDPQRWAPAQLSALLSQWTTFLGHIASHAPAAVGAVTHVNVSYFSGFTVVISPTTGRARNVPTLRGSPVVDTVIAVTADPKIGAQRRRSQQGV